MIDLHRAQMRPSVPLRWQVKDLADQVEKITKIREAVGRTVGEYDRAQLVHMNAQSDRERRDELVAAVQAAKDELELATDAIGKSEPLRESTREKKVAAKSPLDVAQASSDAARRAHELARDDTDYRRQLIEIEQLTERRDRVEDAQKILTSAEETLESIKIDDDLLAEIEQAHLDLAGATSAAERTLPTVQVRALDEIASAYPS